MDNREEYVRKTMGELGQDYTLFHAISPNDLSIVDYMAMSSTYLPSNNPGIFNRPTRLPVGLSFFMCYYDAFVRGYDTILILEDDIKFAVSTEHLTQTIKEWKDAPCEMMYLGYCHMNCSKSKYNSISPNIYGIDSDNRIVCNHAIMLKKSLLEKYFKNFIFLYMTKQNDNILDQFMRNNDIYRCVPPRGYINQNVPELGSNNGNKNDNLHTCHVSTNTRLYG